MATAAAMGCDRLARFEADVVPLMTRLYPTALRLAGNHSDAEDLLQETFARAYVGICQFTPGTNMRAWLHKILANIYFSRYRKQRREPVIADGWQEEWQLSTNPLLPPSRSAETEVLDRLTDSGVLQALRELPESFRMAIYLADVEGYSYHEVADIMGTPIGTVMSRLSRGRRKLRDSLCAQQQAMV